MKSTYIALGVAGIAVIGIIAMYIGESSRANTNDDFINEVRQRAQSVVGKGESGEGIIPGTSGNPDLVPRIRVQEEVVFENIPAGQDYVSYIDIYNDGKAALEIEDVTTECGCTVGEMVDPIIQGGESGKMKITILPEYIYNLEIRRNLSIISNDPVNRMIQLPVTSKIDADLAIDPRYIEFGNVPHGETRTATLRMWQTKDAELKISNIRGSDETSKYVHMDFVELPEAQWREPGKREYDLVFSLAADAPIGPIAFDAECSLSLESQPTLKIPVRAGIIFFATADETIQDKVNVMKAGESAIVSNVKASRPFAVDFSSINVPTGMALAISGTEEDLDRDVLLEVSDSVPQGNYAVIGRYEIIDSSGLSEPGYSFLRVEFRVE